MQVIQQTNEIGQRSFAIQYADGRIIHSGYKSEEAAKSLIAKLQQYLARKAA